MVNSRLSYLHQSAKIAPYIHAKRNCRTIGSVRALFDTLDLATYVWGVHQLH